MTGYLPPPSRPYRKLYEPTIAQRQRGVVWVDKQGGEYGALTDNQALAGLAQRFAREWHRGQTNKRDEDYFMGHLWPVANMARTLAIGFGFDADTVDLIEAYAWLHDAREDQGVTDEMLVAVGLGDLSESIEVLTKPRHMPYADYVAAVIETGSIEVVVVKLADNIVNASTLDDLPLEDQERLTPKYDKVRPLLMRRVIDHVQR